MIEIVVSNKERVVVNSFDEAVEYLMSCCVKRPKSKKSIYKRCCKKMWDVFWKNNKL